MKFLCILFLFSFISINSFSKDKLLVDYQYTLNGLGLSQQKISFLSPVFYEGYSFVSTKGKVRSSNDRIASLVTEFNFDLNFNDHNSNFSSMGYDFRFSKYYLLTLKDYPKTFPKLFVGWGYWFDSDIYFKTYNTNNPLYYNFNNMFCLSFYGETKYKSVKISDELNVPFIGIYSGSEYSSSLPYFINEEDASFFQAFDIGSFGKNLQASNKLNIDYNLKTKKGLRTFRFQYEIFSTVLNLNNNLKHNTFHVFKIGYLFNKNDYEHW